MHSRPRNSASSNDNLGVVEGSSIETLKLNDDHVVSSKIYSENIDTCSQWQNDEKRSDEEYCDEKYCGSYYWSEDSYEDYEEHLNYGDGLDQESFESVQNIIFHLVAATKRLGKVSHDAEDYLTVVLAVCSVAQRRQLMQLENGRHTPLSLACEIGNLDVVRFFVENCDADVNCMNGWPLFWAIIKGDRDMVHYLLEHNANAGAFVTEHYNLLMIAIRIFPKIDVETLGMDDTYDETTRNRVIYGCMKGFRPQIEVIKLLVEKDSVHMCSESVLYTCLAYCMKKSEAAFVELLLDRIPDIDNIRNTRGCSILGYAIKELPINFIAKLIDKGADINCTKLAEIISVPESDENQAYNLQRNADLILRLMDDETKELRFESFAVHNFSYVHPVVYAASHGYTGSLFYLIGLPQIPFQYKLEALEVMGAYFAFEDLCENAKLCWKTAVKMRLQNNVSLKSQRDSVIDQENENHCYVYNYSTISQDQYKNYPCYPLSYIGINELNKLLAMVCQCYNENRERNLLLVKTIYQPRRAFQFQTELDTIEGIESLDSKHEIQVQGALVFERLLGYGSRITMRAFGILERQYKQLGDIKQYVTILTYSLPFFAKFQFVKERDYPDDWTINELIKNLALIISKEKYRNRFDFDTVMAVLKCVFIICSVTPKRNLDYSGFYGLMLAMEKTSEYSKTDDECRQFGQVMRKIVCLPLKNTVGQSLLHLAVRIEKFFFGDEEENRNPDNDSDNDSVISDFRNPLIESFTGPLAITKLLLEFGINPNLWDIRGQTPLHAVYRRIIELQKLKTRVDINTRETLEALLKADAHQDCVDVENKTPIDYSQETDIPLCPVRNRTLQCLASSVILQNNIPYKTHLPLHLIQFVELHKKRGRKNNKGIGFKFGALDVDFYC